ncbi:MAG: heavy metal-associated domain-containing protein [Bacilli bacterium]|nr:heavy metal-associated domain-containing protein [Bacilli bacterium]
MLKAMLQLETLTCPSCSIKIDKALKSLNGVDKDSVNIMFNASKVKLDFNENIISIDQIENTIKNLGYDVKKIQIK